MGVGAAKIKHGEGKSSGAEGSTESDDEYAENGEDDVESHYEPVVVAPGVKLQARAGGRTTAVLDEDVEPIYKKWIEERVNKSVTERICTFHYTDRIFAPQKWYQCNTCLSSGKFQGAEAGTCEVCKDLCHKGHDIGPENFGEFVCSCGEMKCAVVQTAKERDVFEDYKIILRTVIEKDRKDHPIKPPSPVFATSSISGLGLPPPSNPEEEMPLRQSPESSPSGSPTYTPPHAKNPRSLSRAADEMTLDDSRRRIEHEIHKERGRSGSFQG